MRVLLFELLFAFSSLRQRVCNHLKRLVIKLIHLKTNGMCAAVGFARSAKHGTGVAAMAALLSC